MLFCLPPVNSDRCGTLKRIKWSSGRQHLPHKHGASVRDLPALLMSDDDAGKVVLVLVVVVEVCLLMVALLTVIVEVALLV